MPIAQQYRGFHAVSKILWKPYLAATLTAAAMAAPTYAGGTINIGQKQSVSVGVGLRSSFTSAQNGAPDGKSRGEDFSLDSVRLYAHAQLNEYIKATFNTEKTPDNSMAVIDGFAQFEPIDAFNVWLGRLLPPSDRANLDGPYSLATWSLPELVSRYPSYTAGRDNGLLAWGNIDKKLVYSMGAFQGHDHVAGAAGEAGDLLYAGRIALNLFDPEPAPAYYTSSTYFGLANILTVGLAVQHQTNGVGAAAKKGDYNGYNVDMLFETKDVGSGSMTLEGAAYRYDTDGKLDLPTDNSLNNNASGIGGLLQGRAFLLGAAYLFPQQVAWGKFQPYLRYQKFERDKISENGGVALYGGKFKQYDVGVNYVIAGANAKISAGYTESEPDDNTPSAANRNLNQFVVGAQLQL